ncbi:gltp [Symbiodinium sp. CCMP2592]|nr:gltp [Symbiodinium sp. CCMP2592]
MRCDSGGADGAEKSSAGELADCIQQLAVYAAWHAANLRSFLWSSADRDKQKAEALAQQLEGLMPAAEAQTIKALAFRAAWFTANQRRFNFADAAEDQRAVEFYADLLASLTNPELAKNIKSLSLNASWHAANTRSMLWRDAREDACRFERDCSKLATLLRPLSGRQQPENEDGEESEGFRTPRETEEATPTALRRCDSVLDEIVVAWQAVKVSDGSTEASSFLSAASVTVMVFDVFGKLLQGFQADMRKNIEMVQQHVKGEISLEKLVDDEAKAEGSHAKALREGNASMGLLWLSRSLRLLQTMLGKLDAGKAHAAPLSLSRCIQAGYETSLRPHHNFVTRQVISAALLAAPSRTEFLAKVGGFGGDASGDGLGLEQAAAAATAKVTELLEAFTPPLSQVCTHLRSRGIEKP